MGGRDEGEMIKSDNPCMSESHSSTYIKTGLQHIGPSLLNRMMLLYFKVSFMFRNEQDTDRMLKVICIMLASKNENGL